MLSLDDFKQLRREIRASGPASRDGDLEGMAMDFDSYLGACEDDGEDPAR